jgi:hypothetical protein
MLRYFVRRLVTITLDFEEFRLKFHPNGSFVQEN